MNGISKFELVDPLSSSSEINRSIVEEKFKNISYFESK